MSSKKSVSKTGSKASQIKVSENEKQAAKTHLYYILFHNWKAIAGIIPCLINGACPIIMYFVFGNLMSNMSEFSALSGVNVTELSESSFIEYAMQQQEKSVILMHDILIKIQVQCFSLLLIGVLTGVAKFFDSILWVRAGAEIAYDLRANLFRAMMHSEVSFFDENPIGALLTLLGEDTYIVQNCFGPVKSTQIQYIFQFCVGLLMSFLYSWHIALVGLAVVPALALLMGISTPLIIQSSVSQFRHVAASMTIAEETLSAIRTVRAFNQEDREIIRFLDETRTVSKYEFHVGIFINIMSVLIQAVMYAASVGTLYYGGKFLGKKESGAIFETGNLFSCYGYITMCTYAVIALVGYFQVDEKAILACARIMKLTNNVSSIPFDGGQVIDNFKGDIEFRNVSFKYPTRNAFVLRNVSFHIRPGQMGALVGHSGSGKSTCVQLLERFYEAQDGVVLLDGHDIRTLDPRWLHHKISLVSQEPTLFMGTIRENILYGAEEGTTREDMFAAADIANASHFIGQFSWGYEEDVGPKGTQLSGGQRQRIAIARAIIKNPVILIADEATSALDSDSEKKVQKALDKVMRGRTSVIVAHRLSTIRDAHVIYVFDSGEIKEQGNHESLLEKGGFYFNLVRRQLSPEEAEGIVPDEEVIQHNKQSIEQGYMPDI